LQRSNITASLQRLQGQHNKQTTVVNLQYNSPQ